MDFLKISNLPRGELEVFGQEPDIPALGTQTVETLSEEDIQEIVITLEPVGSISGTVFESDQQTPVPSQTVQLWLQQVDELEGRINLLAAETITDENGQYTFENYPLGDYSVRVVKRSNFDGGFAVSSLRFPGDTRVVNVSLRGQGQIQGRVLQTSGTPIISDIIIVYKVFKIVVDPLGNEFFVLEDEISILSSDLLGPNGEVTGEFLFQGPAAGGPFTVFAAGPFFTPTQVTGEIPRATDLQLQTINVGDILLEPATSSVRGRVFLPDGQTPVGEGVLVTINSSGDDGNFIETPLVPVGQPVLPEISVTTDANGEFIFPLVLRGGFRLTADTGAPDPAIRADSAQDLRTDQFEDENGNRILNVRLFGDAIGVAPAGEELSIDVQLNGVAEVRALVVENDGETPVPQAEVSLMTSSNLDEPFEEIFENQIADQNGEISFFQSWSGVLHWKQATQPVPVERWPMVLCPL